MQIMGLIDKIEFPPPMTKKQDSGLEMNRK